MDDLDTARATAALVARLLFALPAVYFLIRSFTPGPRSLRLANLALFCGMLVWVLPEKLIANFTATSFTSVLFISGAIRVLIACTGIGFAFAAFKNRSDRGVTKTRPFAGGAFSVFHLVAGVGMLLFGSYNRPGTQWTYQSPDAQFRVTLPSERWKQVPTPERPNRIAFVRQIPFMQATIMEVYSSQDQADFTRAAENVRQIVDANSGGHPEWRQGTNEAGNPYQYGTVIESPNSDERTFVAHSTTWCRQTRLVIEVLVECSLKMRSETAQAAALEAAQNAAKTICLSVE